MLLSGLSAPGLTDINHQCHQNQEISVERDALCFEPAQHGRLMCRGFFPRFTWNQVRSNKKLLDDVFHDIAAAANDDHADYDHDADVNILMS